MKLYGAKRTFCIQIMVHSYSRLLSYCCDKSNVGGKGLCQLEGYSLSLREARKGAQGRNWERSPWEAGEIGPGGADMGAPWVSPGLPCLPLWG